MPGLDRVDAKSHPPHNIHAVVHGKNDSLLDCARQVSPVVNVEFKPADRCPHVLVAQGSLRPIAIRKDQEPFTSRRYLGTEAIHVSVGIPLSSVPALISEPPVEDSRSIDARQDPVAGMAEGVVDMDKGIDPRFGIEAGLVGNPENDTGSPPGCGDLSWIQNFQG